MKCIRYDERAQGQTVGMCAVHASTWTTDFWSCDRIIREQERQLARARHERWLQEIEAVES